MEIKLGIFTYLWCASYRKIEHAREYPFNDLSLQSVSIVEHVTICAQRAEHIHFVLDGIYLPLGSNITSKELQAIMNDEELVKKTTFYDNGKKIDTQKVVKIYNDTIQGQLKFSDLL